MPIQYDYDVRLNLVRARMSGVLSVEEIKRYFARVARDPNVAAGFVEVVDFGGVDDIAFRYPDAQGILDSYRARAASKGTVGTIFVGSTPLAFGTARMLSGLGDPTMSFEVVRSDEELGDAIERLRGADVGSERDTNH